MKTALTALVLALAPLSAVAEGCASQHVSMSCTDGTTYDAETQSCVPVTG